VMTWLPTLMLPEPLTVRSISITPPVGGGSGGGPAATARACNRRSDRPASPRWRCSARSFGVPSRGAVGPEGGPIADAPVWCPAKRSGLPVDGGTGNRGGSGLKM
jgi:hypothetical protein